MRHIHRPLFWPLRPARLYDTNISTLVGLRIVDADRVESLFRTGRDRYFVLQEEYAGLARIRPVSALRARLWLFTYPAQRDTFACLGIYPNHLVDA